MGIGVSLILIAVGAILWFAVSATVSGIAIHTVGIILVIVGSLGLLFTLAYLGTRSDSARVGRRGDDYLP